MSKGKQVRRTWTRDEKLAILAEIEGEDTTVLDVSVRHNIDRYLLKRWMRQFNAEPARTEASPVFVPVEITDLEARSAPAVLIEVGLNNGRRLTLSSNLSDAQIRRFIVLVEAA